MPESLQSQLLYVITALFLVSMVSVFAAHSSAATTTHFSAAHSGSYILDANGNTVYLRGMGIAGFAPDLTALGSSGAATTGEPMELRSHNRDGSNLLQRCNHNGTLT